MDIWIKRQKKGYAIFTRKKRGGPAESYKCEELTLVNRQLQDATISEETALKMVREIKSKIRPKKKTSFNVENDKLLKQYWEEVYGSRVLEDRDAAENRLYRGVKALGQVSIHVATRHEIQKTIMDHPQQREAAAVINQLLKYLGRPFSIPMNRKKKRQLAYLTWGDYQKAVSLVHCPAKAKVKIPTETLRLFYNVLFVTGCRVGEVFAIDTIISPGKAIILVESQLDDKKTTRATKTHGWRRVPIIQGGIKFVEEWIKVPEDVRKQFRNARLADILGDACDAAEISRLTCRDVRHCYAVELIRLGASLELTAQAMGNSLQVCQEYYSGFVLTDPGLDHLVGLIQTSQKKRKKSRSG